MTGAITLTPINRTPDPIPTSASSREDVERPLLFLNSATLHEGTIVLLLDNPIIPTLMVLQVFPSPLLWRIPRPKSPFTQSDVQQIVDHMNVRLDEIAASASLSRLAHETIPISNDRALEMQHVLDRLVQVTTRLERAQWSSSSLVPFPESVVRYDYWSQVARQWRTMRESTDDDLRNCWALIDVRQSGNVGPMDRSSDDENNEEPDEVDLTQLPSASPPLTIRRSYLITYPALGESWRVLHDPERKSGREASSSLSVRARLTQFRNELALASIPAAPTPWAIATIVIHEVAVQTANAIPDGESAQWTWKDRGEKGTRWIPTLRLSGDRHAAPQPISRLTVLALDQQGTISLQRQGIVPRLATSQFETIGTFWIRPTVFVTWTPWPERHDPSWSLDRLRSLQLRGNPLVDDGVDSSVPWTLVYHLARPWARDPRLSFETHRTQRNATILSTLSTHQFPTELSEMVMEHLGSEWASENAVEEEEFPTTIIATVVLCEIRPAVWTCECLVLPDAGRSMNERLPTPRYSKSSPRSNGTDVDVGADDSNSKSIRRAFDDELGEAFESRSMSISGSQLGELLQHSPGRFGQSWLWWLRHQFDASTDRWSTLGWIWATADWSGWARQWAQTAIWEWVQSRRSIVFPGDRIDHRWQVVPQLPVLERSQVLTTDTIRRLVNTPNEFSVRVTISVNPSTSIRRDYPLVAADRIDPSHGSGALTSTLQSSLTFEQMKRPFGRSSLPLPLRYAFLTSFWQREERESSASASASSSSTSAPSSRWRPLLGRVRHEPVEAWWTYPSPILSGWIPATDHAVIAEWIHDWSPITSNVSNTRPIVCIVTNFTDTTRWIEFRRTSDTHRSSAAASSSSSASTLPPSRPPSIRPLEPSSTVVKQTTTKRVHTDAQREQINENQRRRRQRQKERQLAERGTTAKEEEKHAEERKQFKRQREAERLRKYRADKKKREQQSSRPAIAGGRRTDPFLSFARRPRWNTRLRSGGNRQHRWLVSSALSVSIPTTLSASTRWPNHRDWMANWISSIATSLGHRLNSLPWSERIDEFVSDDDDDDQNEEEGEQEFSQRLSKE